MKLYRIRYSSSPRERATRNIKEIWVCAENQEQAFACLPESTITKRVEESFDSFPGQSRIFIGDEWCETA